MNTNYGHLILDIFVENLWRRCGKLVEKLGGTAFG
jgi:hypothetical protein